MLGIDGCREGWVAVRLDEDGRFADAQVGASLEVLLAPHSDLPSIGIDMPLHLLDAASRPADLAARKALGPARGRSVFPALPRFAIEEEWMGRAYDAVNRECQTRFGSGISRQSFSLRRKIAEINAAFAAGLPVIEVHPELSFATMNGGAPLAFSKKAWGGQRERLLLLAREGIVLPDSLPDPVMRLAPDDLIDAAAAAWSARRHHRGIAQCLPAGPANSTEPRIWT